MRSLRGLLMLEKWITALASLFLCALPVHALDPSKLFGQYVLRSWSLQNGLPQKSVMAVAQTTDGYIWLGTEEGLVRFDGLSFRTFDEQNSPGLPDRLVRSLAASRDGSLWIGTRSGLVHYRNGVFSNLAKQSGFLEDIYDLCESRDGSIWFSSDHGLYRFKNAASTVYTTRDGLPDNRITAIAQGADGSVWVGTRAGLVRFAGQRFTTFIRERETLGNSINALTLGAHGVVWIGTTGGEIDRWSDGRITPWWRDPRRHAKVEGLREDRDGTLWVAFQHTGLARLRGHRLELFTKEEGLPSNDPDWIFEDQTQQIWIGWADAGLSALHDGKFTSFGTREGLSSDRTSSVMQSDDGSLWVGTEDGGLNRIRDGRVDTYSDRNRLSGRDLVSVLQTGDGVIWAGSDHGFLNRWSKGRVSVYGKQQSAPPRISALLQDREGVLWVAFEEHDGLARFVNGKFEHIALKGRPRALAQAPDGALWIAAYNGGVFRCSRGAITNFTEAEGLSSNKAISLYVDRAGIVWAGTAQAGLNRIEHERITRYSVRDGLFDSTVGAILEDGLGQLWLTSTRGIARVDKQELNAFAEHQIDSVHAVSYGVADGLRSAECSITAQPAAWKATNGTLWFATTGGLASIDATALRVADLPPHVNLDGIFYGGQLIEPKTSELSSGSGRLEFNFTAPAFRFADRVRVRYRLDGYDTNWIEANARRTATYTNLAPQDYTFRVEAASSSGVWDSNEAVYRFRLLPEFYQTVWFRLLAVMLFGSAAWAVYLARVRYLVEQNRELEDKVQSRTADLQRAVEAAELARELLREQATRDTLTGLWNRRAIFDILENELANCRQHAAQLAVLMIDLDHFKSINDRLGHLAGDQVLQQAAVRLVRGVREREAVGRYGGEEIMIVLPNCPLDSAVKRADELRATLEYPSMTTDAGAIRVTCSIGASGMGPGCSARDLMGAADIALYEAKAAGRNCVRARPPAIEPAVESELTLARN